MISHFYFSRLTFLPSIPLPHPSASRSSSSFFPMKNRCRAIYRRYALVSTTPTAKGKEEIDAFHPLYGLHYLERKPVTEFSMGSDRTQWLQIEKGKVCFAVSLFLLDANKGANACCVPVDEGTN